MISRNERMIKSTKIEKETKTHAFSFLFIFSNFEQLVAENQIMNLKKNSKKIQQRSFLLQFDASFCNCKFQYVHQGSILVSYLLLAIFHARFLKV